MDSHVMGGSASVFLDAPTNARAYLAAARSFFSGVTVLARDAADSSQACIFLAGQALECGLKAHLASIGYSTSRLNHAPLGHNLEALWYEAATRGLDLPAKPPTWCSHLNDERVGGLPPHAAVRPAPDFSHLLLLVAELAIVLAALGKTV